MGDGSSRILVPVGESSTFRNTVAYAVREARSGAADGDASATVHFVYPARWRAVDGDSLDDSVAAAEVLDRVTVWAQEDLDYEEDEEAEVQPEVEIKTAFVGADRYLFSPGDFADVVLEYAQEFDLDRVIVDPEFRPGGSAPMLRPFEMELARSPLSVEEAPVERRTTRAPLVSRATLSKGIVTFGACFGFYLLIAGTLTPFNLATGGLTAFLAAVAFSSVSFVTSPSPRRTGLRILRMGLFVPYLVWEITKANISIAYIILHPRLPIDPDMRRFRAAVWGGLPVTTLGNSITLTPGTLTVDVGRDGLDIHTLTGSARDDLAAGGLERAVRFVFYGRPGARIPAPSERGSIEPVGDDAGAETVAESGADSLGEPDAETLSDPDAVSDSNAETREEAE